MKRELSRGCERAGVLLGILVRIVVHRDGRHRAVSPLSAWEGFGRFTREIYGVEPLTLLRSWRLLAESPVQRCGRDIRREPQSWSSRPSSQPSSPAGGEPPSRESARDAGPGPRF
jgi:hypothetical protein